MDSIRSTHFQESFNRQEKAILRLIKAGLSNNAIAQKLSLSLETVKWYNRQIFGKLGVNSRTQAIEKAAEIGLVEAWLVQFPIGSTPLYPPGRNTICLAH